MLRPPFTHLAALFLSIVLVPACGGSPPPRPSTQNPRRATDPAQSGQISSVPGQAPPPVAAQSAIIVDPDSGRVLYAKNADVPRAVASTQKIITALCVLDAGDIDKTVVVDKSDGACEPTKLDLKPGETYSRRKLLKALMVKSANDVARALARDVGGSQEGFAALMNQKAASIGMRNSHFMNPNGLTLPGQQSTARDMAIAARAAYRSPLLRSFVATKSFDFQYADGHTKLLENTNHILKSVPYCNGMKTGTTDLAGRCLVCTGSLNGRSAIIVLLKSNTPNVWKDGEKLLRWALETPTAG
jgi:D-alanyl-D-alanine carboxypeptidase (penicillin-binding protein 5/6)